VADNEERKNSDDGSEPRSLREELQIEDLSCCLFFKDQKIFAAAGPGLPLMQMNADGTFVSLDPEQPYSSEIHEEVAARADEYGRLLNPLGELCKLTGMKYNGKPLFFVKEKQPENGQHLAAWFDDGMKPHYLHLGDTLLSGPMIIKIRDRMIMVDGELTNFPEISSD
jgi:hypothetical protein